MRVHFINMISAFLRIHTFFLTFLFFTLSSSEKHKAEIKDRKVLEILQSKDYKIQELEQVQYGLVKYSKTFCV